MIPKKLIEEAALKYAEDFRYVNNGNNLYKDWAITDYTKGVEFAEKQLSELAIEFGNFINNNCFYLGSTRVTYNQSVYSIKELFEIFTKEKYEK